MTTSDHVNVALIFALFFQGGTIGILLWSLREANQMLRAAHQREENLLDLCRDISDQRDRAIAAVRRELAATETRAALGAKVRSAH
jgi:hypothetical protein